MDGITNTDTGTGLIDDGWGEDIDLSDVTGDESEAEAGAEEQREESETADQSGAEEEKPAEDADAQQKEQEADQSLELKYMGETRRVSKDEAVALAQKGMDYDRIRQKLDEQGETVSLLEELAKEQGLSLDELIDQAHASMLSRKENLTPEQAKERVGLLKRERAIAAREKRIEDEKAQESAQKAGEDKRQADILRFVQSYPKIDPASIPKEVWAEVSQGGTLTEAYARYENRQLRLQLEAEQKNRENREKSAGSRDNPGGSGKEDPYDKYWNEDD